MVSETLNRWLVGLGVALAAWILGWLITRLLFPRLGRLFRRSKTKLDDTLLSSIRPHVPLWFAVLGVLLGVRFLSLDPETVRIIGRVGQTALLLSATLALASFVNRLILDSSTRWSDAFRSTSLVQHAVRITVVGLGALMILSNLGIAITPILTALGVGSLAVALALQPTLTNLFAGFHISLAGQVRIGDYVALESGQKGFVTDIGWRSTLIRELPNNLIVVPNARLAEIIVTNYSLPEPEQSAIVGVGVSYDSNLEHVEKVTIDVARETLKNVQGGVGEFDPFIRYNGFGDSSVDFSVILRVRTFTDRYLVSHEFMKRLHRRYQAEGIEIPFPQRVVTLNNGTAPREAAGAGRTSVSNRRS